MPDCHPSDDLLEQYSLGRLPDSEAEWLEEHLLICVACQDRLAETDSYVRAMRAELQAPAPSWWEQFLRRCRAWLPRPLSAAGALAALALLWVWTGGVWPERDGPGEPALVVPLAVVRGAPAAAHAPAGKRLALRPDVAGLPTLNRYRLQVVDWLGRPVLERSFKAGGGEVELPRGLPAGRYWVRLHEPGPAAALLREYGLEVNPSDR